ncbi:hypothetical protein METSCH_E05120 [Metschnikowia aff. pulcherrima]|uniref:Uncharacterized protein n=1 Tax=Metschnikowia aff. pulcherrima TaxID=2163413 RepID=A0A4P6XRT3_9ASCO|nr:hypothetical protein METSCH_E05120 [Metschnikowia aff. pulcherrima]
MHVVSRHELSAEAAFEDAPRGIDESSSIFSTIERNVPVNAPPKGGKSSEQRKKMKTQIKSFKKTFVRKVKSFRPKIKLNTQTSTTHMATELHSPMEQIAILNTHHIHQSPIPQTVPPSASAFLPYEADILVPDSPLDSEMPVPTWYAAHVPTLQNYVAEGVNEPGLLKSKQSLKTERFANIPRTVLSMIRAFFHMRGTKSDIESALSDSSDQKLGISKTSAELAMNDSDLSTLGDDSSSLKQDITFYDFSSLFDGLPAIDSGPMFFAAIINLAPEIEGPLQAMQATPKNAALPERPLLSDIVVQDAGMRPRTFASSCEGRFSPFSDFADEIGQGDEASSFSLTSPILPLFCRNEGSRSSSSSDILAPAGSLLPEYTHMPEHANIGTAQALQPNVEGLALANFGDLIAEIDGIIQEAAKPASARIHEDSSSTKRESWICNFLNFDRRRNSLLATGDYESENSDQEEFLENCDTNGTYEHNERTGILIERCNENLSLGRRWITTKLLLDRIEKDTGYSDTTEETSEADNYERCPFEISIVDRTEKAPCEQRPLRFARKLSEHSTRNMDFDTISKSLSDYSEWVLRRVSKAETEELKEIVYAYRTLFRHLIRAMVWPCGDELRRLIQKIFYVRLMETEVVAEAARINREISATMANFVEFPAKFLAYLQARLERCSPAFECLEKLSKKCHEEMVLLETEFNSNIENFVGEIKANAAIRVRALDLHEYFVKVFTGRKDFDEDYIHEWSRVAEYRRITLWYQDVNTARFQSLLAKNISTLSRTGKTILEILTMTHGSIQSARKVLSMTEEGSLVS